MRTIHIDEVIERLDLIIDDEDTEELQISHTVCKHHDTAKRPQCLVGQLFSELELDWGVTGNATVDLALRKLRTAQVVDFDEDASLFLIDLQTEADRMSYDPWLKARSWRAALESTLKRWYLA